MVPKIKDILFATDMSANADHALAYCLGIARDSGAKVHVIHVLEPLSSDAVVTLQVFVQDEAVRTRAIQDRHQTIRAVLKKNQEEFLASLGEGDRDAYNRIESVELLEGHSADAILKRAQDLDCGLIVMGAHEQGTGHTFLGSTVKRVMRRSRLPVLVVPYAEDI